LCSMFRCLCFFFFFQAEDGIRDFHVTGVQTCALPIYLHYTFSGLYSVNSSNRLFLKWFCRGTNITYVIELGVCLPSKRQNSPLRSEERRVGKECRARWATHH